MSNYFSRILPYELALSGRLFEASFYLELAGNAVSTVQIKTGNKSCSILAYQVASSAEPLKIEAVETPTITDGTTSVPVFNVNRQKTATATTVLYSDPTNISAGTLIHSDVVAAGKGSGAALLAETVWTLKKDTSYVWRITQLTNQATKVAGSLTFAEDFQIL